MTKYNWDERHIITFPEKELALETKDLHVYYGQKEAIKGIDMKFEKNKITALIGPSGCGKSTFLRSLNRMNDTIDIAKVTGQILYEGVDVILAWSFSVLILLPSLFIKILPLPTNVKG